MSGEAELRGLASSLQEVGVAFKLWVEQPENVPTCLAPRQASRDTSRGSSSLSDNSLTCNITVHIIIISTIIDNMVS